MILAGDIGGTKTRVGLFEREGVELRLVRERRYPSGDFASLSALLRAFLDPLELARVEVASFGVAGPVFEDAVHATNLPWTISAAQLAGDFGIERVRLSNDLVATAAGLPHLVPADVEVLQPGLEAPQSNAVLIAAGTGLGMALLPRIDGVLRPRPSEGGHADFAPRDEAEDALRRFVAQRVGGRVSVERIVSGLGIPLVYEHLRERGVATERAELRERLRTADPARAISEAALAGDELALAAMRAFVSAYGAAAGNLALVGLASAGVWIAGGIAPKILPLLREGAFLESFRDKGRFRELLERVPVRVVLRADTALWGAAALGG